MPIHAASGWRKAAGEFDPVNFDRVLQKELGEIKRRRRERHGDTSHVRTSLVGLAFSGGGIRSATFNLGVLQALAELKLLRAIDYLSTVSGGGYIGSWLHALLHRKNESSLAVDATADDGDIGTAEDWLSPQGEESPAVGFLRRYSNYLTPRVGAFTVDTWSLAVTYLRNTLLNLCLVVALLAVALMAPRLAHLFFELCANSPRVSGYGAMGLVMLGAIVAGSHIGAYTGGTSPARSWRYRSPAVVAGVAAPLSIAALGAAASLSRNPLAPLTGTLLGAAGYTLAWVVAAAAALRAQRTVSAKAPPVSVRDSLHRLLYCGLAGLGAGAILSPLSHRLEASSHCSWALLLWGAPSVVALFILFGVLHIGLAGRRLPDEHREWLSRLAAWVLLLVGGWIVLVGIVTYGPALVAWLGIRLEAALSVGWLASTLGGLLAGRSLERGASGRIKALVAELAPYVFVLGLLLLLAVAIDAGLGPARASSPDESESAAEQQPTQGSVAAVDPRSGAKLTFSWAGAEGKSEPSLADAIDAQLARLNEQSENLARLGAAVALLAALAVLLGWRIDVNEFSMHHLYRNRLVRCYLGATLSPRRRIARAQPFTGFHPDDDLPLHELATAEKATGPYPLINAAVNLVRGHQLAWQQRKAASFLFSPHFCGFETTGRQFGYRRTSDAKPGGRPLSLGTALTISGAAVSPNMGYHSSRPLAFLLTVFNVRLGMWLGNPASRGQWESPGPKFAVTYLVREMLGLTTEESAYVSLSDGGHFENLGLYELIRRRCRYIVVCDAGSDADLTFEDLANAIRKCRTDHGAEIRLSTDSLRRQADGRSRWHAAVGTIRYAPQRASSVEKLNDTKSPADGGVVESGILVYLKATLTGDEPEDVAGYAAREPEFPHQSTADQFFDESQFESYRMLGYHIAMSVFRGAVETVGRSGGQVNVPQLFLQLRQRWHPPASGAVSFTEHTRTLDGLFERARSSKKLAFLDRQFYLGWDAMRGRPPKHDSPVWLPPGDDELREGFYFCNSLIQLMENVYLDLHLDGEHDHPDNRGWMNLFRQWSWSGMFRATWALSGSTYGQRFQTFSEQRLGLRPFDAIRVETVVADQIGTSALNPLERDIAVAFLEKQKEATVLALAAVVRDPVAKGDAALMTYPCGFAMLVGEKLSCLRIQDHVRKMGLGRAALRELIQGAKVKSLSEELDLPTELSVHFPPTDRERLRDLFRSVSAECRSAAAARTPASGSD